MSIRKNKFCLEVWTFDKRLKMSLNELIIYWQESKEDYQVCSGLFLTRGSHLYLFGVCNTVFIHLY